MQLLKSLKYAFPIILLLMLLVFAPGFNIGPVIDTAKFELSGKSDLVLSLSPVDSRIRALSDDPQNQLVLKLKIMDSQGLPVPGAGFIMSASDKGEISPASGRTAKDGSCLVTYRPSLLPDESFINGKYSVSLKADIPGSASNASLSLNLVRIPVIFIHGYKASPSIFGSFSEYLVSEGYACSSLAYDSEKGVSFGASQLDSLLDKEKEAYLEKGILIERFNLIGHSMGGLVARYYTCSEEYLKKNNVKKIIFVSVPQNGSELASLGLKYYNDRGISDLIPEGELFTKLLPNMKNKGLNNTIQAGNILGQYDEVVSEENASLEEWGIKTEIFNVGENNFTVEKLLSGKIAEAANHKAVLNNKNVCFRVKEMLANELLYPIKR